MTWLPAFLMSVLSSIIAVAVTYGVVKTKVDSLGTTETEIKRALDSASKELQNAVIAIAVMSKEQAVINKFVTATLEGIIKKQEYIEKRVNEQGSTVDLLVELVKRIERSNIE